MATDSLIPMSRLSRGYMDRRRHAFTLAEMLISVAILVALMGIVFGFVLSAQAAFNNADAGIQLRNIFRTANDKMAWELSHTGHDGGGNAQYIISTGTGVNGSDTIRFSVPVVCDAVTPFLDATGNPAHWGAYLTWGCDSVTCADANGACATVEYKYVQYALSATGVIVRSVLGPMLNVVSSASIADGITNMHFSVAGNQLTFSLSGQRRSLSGAMLTGEVDFIESNY